MYAPLLLLNLVATWLLVGLIWVIQVVQYPLFARVGSDAWVDYHRNYTRLITYVVAPAMFVELATAASLPLAAARGLSPDRPGAAAEAMLLWVGLVLAALVWASTFAIQVPQHARLSEGFDRRLIGALAAGNWIRTALWSARGLITAVLAYRLLRPA